MNKKLIGIISGAAGLAALAGTAFAANAPAQGHMPMMGDWNRGAHASTTRQMAPGVFGTVSSVSGETLTVSTKAFSGRFGTSTATTSIPAKTYTVDASNAVIVKNGATSTVSAIASGDMVSVQGTVSGSNVAATRITDGRPAFPQMKRATSTAPVFQGNGEPVVAGSVSAINGSNLTLANKSNVTYSVDISNATIEKKGATTTASSIAVGDELVVQGAVNGNSVTASSVIDQAAPQASNAKAPQKGGFVGGIFGGIASFFTHLFGF